VLLRFRRRTLGACQLQPSAQFGHGGEPRGQLAALGLVVLTDTKGVQPVYAPAPTIRAEVLARYPQIADLLAPVFQSLTLETLQTLNARIAVEGTDAKKVATDYLTEKGFLK